MQKQFITCNKCIFISNQIIPFTFSAKYDTVFTGDIQYSLKVIGNAICGVAVYSQRICLQEKVCRHMKKKVDRTGVIVAGHEVDSNGQEEE